MKAFAGPLILGTSAICKYCHSTAMDKFVCIADKSSWECHMSLEKCMFALQFPGACKNIPGSLFYKKMTNKIPLLPFLQHFCDRNIQAIATNILFLAVMFGSAAHAQVSFTESFETDSAGQYFGMNGQTFVLVNKLGVQVENPAVPASMGHGVGAGGTGTSNRFISNNCAGCNTPNISYITTPGSTAFRLSSLYFFASTRIAGDTPTSGGSIVFRGKLNGNTVFTLYKSNGWPVSLASSNGFSFFDFAMCNTWTDSSSANNITNISIDSLEIELSGGFVYEAIDLFTWKKSPPVVSAKLPVIGGTSAILKGDVINPGSSTVTGRGFVYNIIPGQISGTWLPCGSGTGLFNDTTGTLLPNTTYYYRAYAINAQDTAYDTELTFTTKALLSSGVDSIHVTCNGKANGTVSVSPSGGGFPYRYLWSPGGQTDSSLNNIGPGVYTCTITDALGVQLQKTASVSEPAPFSNNIITNADQFICYNHATAPLTAGVPSGGGSGTYRYKWISSITGPQNVFFAASGKNDTAGYAPGTRTLNTWFRRLVMTTYCVDTSPAVAVTVTPVLYNNSLTLITQSMCAGSTALTIVTGSTPLGGSGYYTYEWFSSTTSATTGFISEGMGSPNFAPGVRTQSTWFKRKVKSGMCEDMSSTVFLTVNPVITNNAPVTSSGPLICFGTGGINVDASAPSGGNGSYSYTWLASTSGPTDGFMLAPSARTGQNYVTENLTQTTWYRRLVKSGGCTDTSTASEIPVMPWIVNTIIGDQTICAKTMVTLNQSAPTGGNGSYTYQWISSTTGTAGSYAVAPGISTTQSYAPGLLTASTWYRRIVFSGICTDTSQAIKITVDYTNTWTGNINADWGNAQNWSCGFVPDTLSNVIIPTSTQTPYLPVITNAQVCNDLTINAYGRLKLNHANASLKIHGNFVTDLGTDTPLHQVAGQIIFGGLFLQSMPHASYSKVVIDNPAGVKLTYNIKLTDSLKFVRGSLFLNYSQLWLAGTQSRFAGAGAGKHIVCNGSSYVKLDNLGVGGRTGNFEIPLGTTTYTPITLSNSGAADNFYIRVYDSVYLDGYTGFSIAVAQNVVNRSWIIFDEMPGGNNVTVKLGWNAADELPGFNRSMAHLNSFIMLDTFPWNIGPVTASAGSGPYNITRSGLNTDFNLFTVSSGGALPVELMHFSTVCNKKDVLLSWSTASEINNAYFRVQRSADQQNYEDIATVNGQGSTQIISDYHYTDQNAFEMLSQHDAPVLYYRLAQVDHDGRVNYSPVNSVQRCSINETALTVFPNPYSDHATIRLAGTNAGDNIIFQLTDLSGHLISSGDIKGASGETLFDTFSLSSDLENGIYFLAVQYGTQRQIIKIGKLK